MLRDVVVAVSAGAILVVLGLAWKAWAGRSSRRLSEGEIELLDALQEPAAQRRLFLTTAFPREHDGPPDQTILAGRLTCNIYDDGPRFHRLYRVIHQLEERMMLRKRPDQRSSEQSWELTPAGFAASEEARSAQRRLRAP